MTNKAPLTLQWDVDADWLYSVLRYADKNPDQFPDAAEDKITLDTDDVQIIIDALNKPDLTARIAELEAENARLRDERDTAHQLLVDCSAIAKKYGECDLWDAVDNDGDLYQSQGLADVLKVATQLTAPTGE